MRVRAVWAAAAIVLHCLLAVVLHCPVVAAQSSLPSPPLWVNESNAMQSLRQQLKMGSAWPSGEDPCSYWRGVICVGGYIDTLVLTGLPSGLNGAKPPALSSLYALQQLRYLRVLNASQVTFSGAIPDWFGSLSSLEALDLSGCTLTGSLPYSFGSLYRLGNLSLSMNSLNGALPPTFGNLSSLTYLNLSSNVFVGSIPHLNASSLTVLDLSQNHFSGGIPPQLGSLQSLQFVNLSHNLLNMSLPLELGNLAVLNQLDVSNNSLQSSIPPELGNLTNLMVAKFSYNNFSGSLPSNLSGFKALQILMLNYNSFSGALPETIGLLPSLVTLDISTNTFIGLLPSGLLSMPSLQSLNISQNFFYGSLPQEGVAAQQEFETMDLSNNYFDGTIPYGFLSSADTRKNCLAQVEKQHPLRVCKKFYGSIGLTFSFNATSSSEGTDPSPPPDYYAASPSGNMQQDKSENRLAPVLAGIFGGVGLITFVGVMVFYLHSCQMRRCRDRAMESGRVSAVGGWGQTFTYSQLQSATNKFSLSNLICVGHSGDLYKGELSGTSIVVKKISLNRVKRDLYLSELEVFDKASHTKLVSLLGTCLDREEQKFLVYKYYPNSDLASSLHKTGSPGPCEDVLQSLDWITRLKIAIGVAEGLSFLHSECSPPIIHRDVKASSILLDDKYEVRIGSLSESRVQDSDSHSNILTRMFGFSSSSCDHADPSHGIVSSSYDVYCFGKVLLELVSGKLGISGSTDNQWLDEALPLINVNDKEGLPKIVDPSLIVDEDLIEEVWAMAIIAKACLNSKPSKRPSMKHVLKALENPHKVVREENFGESLSVRTSSHSSWNEVLFGSFRHHNSVSGYFRGGGGATGGGNGEDYPGMLPIARAPGLANSNSQNSREMYHLHHMRRGSSDIVPEPIAEVAHESDDGR